MAQIITAEEALSTAREAFKEVLPRAVIVRCNEEIFRAAQEGRTKTTLTVPYLSAALLGKVLLERHYKILFRPRSGHSDSVELTVHWTERQDLTVA